MPASRPTRTFRPTKFNVLPVKARASRRRGSGRAKTVYVVRVDADSWRWQRSFDRKGHADSFARRLNEKYALGWHFDPSAIDMVDPDAKTQGAPAATVFSTTLEYVRSGWPNWRPNTRRLYVFYLSRARRWMLRNDAPTPGDELREALDRYTRRVSLRLASKAIEDESEYVEDTPDDLAKAADWLEEWSLPVDDVDASAIRSFLSRFDYYVPKHPAEAPPPPPRRASATSRATVARHTKTWWNWLRDGGVVSHDPFRAARHQVKGTPSTRADDVSIDPDIVLTPAQLFRLADHMAAAHPSGRKWWIYAPLLGLEGLRPGEGLGLRRRFFDLPPEGDTQGHGWLVFDEQRPTSGSRVFTDPEERDEPSAPLKGRRSGEFRRVPVFPQLIRHLRRHFDLYVDDDPDALVLTGVRGGPLDIGWFGTQIWEPARASFVSELRETGQHQERVLRKLEGLRRHDLRHAAASFWLRVPVSPKLAQKWGGWRDLSTFLNVYQGVLVGEEDEAIKAASDFLGDIGHADYDPDEEHRG